MSILVTPQGVFKLYQFDTEKEFERCVVSQVEMIFSKRCVYLDCKRRIGKQGSKQSTPTHTLLISAVSASPNCS
jgi:ABC-type antimicrobial peptide transport system ATPase subunit